MQREFASDTCARAKFTCVSLSFAAPRRMLKGSIDGRTNWPGAQLQRHADENLSWKCDFDRPFCGQQVQAQERVSMTTGTVKWFNSQKGFGFIAPDNGGTDAFVHISAVERAGLSDLVEGQKIEFDLVADKKSGKMAAENLKTVA
jgi:CspA family cold shock protein